MSAPSTLNHYAPNDDFVTVGGVTTDAAQVDGFNIADVTDPSQLGDLTGGTQAMIWVGDTIPGNTAAFRSEVLSYVGGGVAGRTRADYIYLADEPLPGQAAALKAESDWVHQNTTLKTFIIEENDSDDTTPVYDYTPANTDIDLFGLDPYPAKDVADGGFQPAIIGDAIGEANSIGITDAKIVPVYQAFGGGSYAPPWIMPTSAQETTILNTWGADGITNPQFDYAYSWGQQEGDTSISDTPWLESFYESHNVGGGGTYGMGAVHALSAANEATMFYVGANASH